jgi:hypothetical protein
VFSFLSLTPTRLLIRTARRTAVSRSKLVIVVVLAAWSLAAGCGGASEKPVREASKSPTASTTLADGRRILALTKGSTITVPAPGATGVVTASTPVSLEFTKVECAARIPGVGFDKKYRNIDLVAARGKQLCLVELAVTNVGRKKNFFTSRDISKLRTTDGREFAMTRKTYDYQAIADQNGQHLASTADLIKPGVTKYDYTIYELPTAEKPDAVLYDIVAAG